MAKYNGHSSWNAWNVSLWINNDEGLYTFAKDCMESTGSRKRAAQLFMQTIRSGQLPFRTPDGGIYNYSSVYKAMEGM
jgi:hypothetical protein